MVWNGGLWNWLDPLTVLRALALLRRQDARWTLAFAGVGRPGRDAMEVTGEAIALARELGLEAAGAVHFGGWTPFADRGRALLEADLGVTAHRETLEARFAVRTRILDLLWARVPILATEGDDWSAAIAEEQLGETVRSEDAEALAAAARRIADNGRAAYEPQLARAAAARSWDRVAAPLVEAIERAAGGRGRRLRPTTAGLVIRHGLASAIAARRSS
jgi:glycosyltransferase involved in cell wall biosynthesis